MTTSSDIQKIYIGYFGRAGDPGGLNYWVGRADGGASLDQIANTFAVLPEAQALYTWLAAPNLDVGVAEFVTQVYNNLFERNPEAGGLKFWTEYLVKNGVGAAGTFIETVIQAAANTEGGAQDKTTLNNKAVVASYFTTEFLRRGATWDNGDIPQARAVVADVNSNPDSVVAGKDLADQFITDDLKPPAPTPKSFYLTTGTDNLKIGALDTVYGDSATFNQSDTVVGSSGTVQLDLTDVTASGTLNTLDLVRVNPNGNVTINAENWTNIKRVEVNEIDANKNFTMNEVQGSIPVISFNDVKNGSTATVGYDAQDLNSNNRTVNLEVKEFNGKLVLQTDTDPNNGSTTRTINLKVNDVAGFESNMQDLEGFKTETLNISGGAAGINFTIGAQLDPTIKVLNASALLSNAKLDVSASTEAMNLSMGTGNDTVNVGDTLFSNDTVSGGAGKDRLIATFTNPASRVPTMSGFETLEANFTAPVFFYGNKVTGLETIDLKASSGRASFIDMDSTLKTVNVQGNLQNGVAVEFADGATGTTEVTFNIQNPTSDTPAAPPSIFVPAINNAGSDSGIQAINADKFTLNHNGTNNVTINNGIRLDDDFSGHYTKSVTIQNNGTGDLFLNGNPIIALASVIREGNTVQDLTVKTTSTGAIYAPNYGAPALQNLPFGTLMEEARQLRNYTIDAAIGSTITVGEVGSIDEATLLRTIDVKAGIASRVAVGRIDADDDPLFITQGAAVIDRVNITADVGSTIRLHGNINLLPPELNPWWLQAASINRMEVKADTNAFIGGDAPAFLQVDTPLGNNDGIAIPPSLTGNSLIGLDLNEQANGSSLVVSGNGAVTGFNFLFDNVSTIDATGLTQSSPNFLTQFLPIFFNNPGIVIFNTLAGFAPNLPGGPLQNVAAPHSFTFHGSNFDDYVTGTSDDKNFNLITFTDLPGGGDTLNGNGGRDVLIGFGGSDFINGGTGNDSVYGDNGYLTNQLVYAITDGNDAIDGGAGNDLIVGGGNGLANTSAGLIGDTLTGGSGDDTFLFDLRAGATDLGKSTNPAGLRQDIITDFTPGGDRIVLDVAAPTPVANYRIAIVDNNLGNNPTLIGGPFGAPAEIDVVLRRGVYNADGTFSLSSSGKDLQALFNTEGDPFTWAAVAAAPTATDAGNWFVEAEHEVGLIDAASKIGSISLTDFVFI